MAQDNRLTHENITMAEIIGTLEPRVGRTVLDAALTEIAAKRMTEVRPGDLITAEWMNSILRRLGDLERSASDSQSGAGPKITFFVPPDRARVGETLTINGSNFDMPPWLNEVLIKVGSTVIGVPQASFLKFTGASNTSQLVFEVPTIPGIPSDGVKVQVSVTTSRGSSAPMAYHLNPQPAPRVEDFRPARARTTDAKLIPGENAVIRGSNFSPDPANNRVFFRDNVGEEEAVVTAVLLGKGNLTTLSIVVPGLKRGGAYEVTLKVSDHPETKVADVTIS